MTISWCANKVAQCTWARTCFPKQTMTSTGPCKTKMTRLYASKMVVSLTLNRITEYWLIKSIVMISSSSSCRNLVILTTRDCLSISLTSTMICSPQPLFLTMSLMSSRTKSAKMRSNATLSLRQTPNQLKTNERNHLKRLDLFLITKNSSTITRTITNPPHPTVMLVAPARLSASVLNCKIARCNRIAIILQVAISRLNWLMMMRLLRNSSLTRLFRAVVANLMISSAN